MSNTSLLHADRLREDIDRGRGGDKVPFPDPAAAPLGTDDEAAGTPPSRPAVARARAQELRPPSGEAPGVTHEAPRGYDDNRGGASPLPFVARVIFWLAAIMVLGGLVVAWID
ncbi:hypothetical protein [Ancylobacter oerskovii]|uniref:Uncharacterized protein n=1 Tax=Ancylobacter oerskovii TaxID=459519 RepID=A0ABW4YVL5_9HYPH|nr:hypothetical protein [Ancylobacter oerskovii]MBS7544273.1 hypothetical protein [Ancylobacter oerskovii]